MSTKKQVSEVCRDTSGRWLSGQSPNPNGRPANAEKVRELLEPHREDLIKKVVAMALDGDSVALKICLDRLAPAPKSELSLVKIEGLENATSISAKATMILNSIGNGEISTEIGLKMLSAIESYTGILHAEELEKRVTELEAVSKARNKY